MASSTAGCGNDSFHFEAMLTALMTPKEPHESREQAAARTYKATIFPVIAKLLDRQPLDSDTGQFDFTKVASRVHPCRLEVCKFGDMVCPKIGQEKVASAIRDFQIALNPLVSVALSNRETTLQRYCSTADAMHKLQQEGLSESEERNWRGPFGIAFYPVMRALVHRHTTWRLQEKAAILEVGAGYIDFTRKSYLSTLLRGAIAAKVTYSDVNPKIVKHGQEAVGRRFQRVDLASGEKDLQECFWDAIIGASVMDALTTSQLDDAICRIYKSLKKDGYFIHFSDFQPFINTLFDYAEKLEGHIAFPVAKDNHAPIGIQVISKEKLQEVIASRRAELSTVELDFLEWYSETTPFARTCFMMSLNPARQLFGFSEWAAKLFEPHRRVIFLDDFFHERMESALKKAGFAIHHSGFDSETMDLDLEKTQRSTGNNVLINAHGHAIRDRQYVLRTNCVRLVVKAHVVIAQKR